MKPELSEKLLVETLVEQSIENEKSPFRGDFDIDKLTGDASTRRYYRVTFKEGSLVVCLDTPMAESSTDPDFLVIQNVLEKENVPVPKIWDIDRERGYYLEEDLGDRTFLMELGECRSRQDEYATYEKAIEALVQMHKIDTNKHANTPFVKRTFDYDKLNFEMNFTIQHFVEGLMGHKRESYNHKFLSEQLDSIVKKLIKGPWVFTHRDYHSRNIMMVHGKMVVIDFQDARLGLPQYDLTSLLEDCYYELDEKNQKNLIELYWNKIGAALFDGDRERFDEMYYLMAIQRIFKAIGSFSYIYRVRSDIRYLRHIGRAFERLKDILYQNKEHTELRQLLCKLYYAY